jgi:hypothetical protein
MARVLVLAEDECVRFTCAEVLRRIGFAASVGPLRGAVQGDPPDVLLIWEPKSADVADALATHGSVPSIVFAWDRRQHWPEGVTVVFPPFNAERIALALHQAVYGSADGAPAKAPAGGAATVEASAPSDSDAARLDGPTRTVPSPA